MHFNIRSVFKNGDEMVALLGTLKHQPDIIAISETFFNSTNVCDFTLSNYIGFHSIRKSRKRGGVSIFIKESLHSEIVEEFSYITPEIEICTRVSHPGIPGREIPGNPPPREIPG